MKRLFVLFIVLAVSFGPLFSQKKETYQVRTVVIDPGHGGAKPGAQGSRSWEKNITLAVAKKFGKLIEDNYPDVKVIYTRTNDADISLAERARIANSNKADLFVSIHANSHPTSSPTGVETFVMGLSESRANLEVAKKENADILLESDYKSNSAYSDFDPNSPESYVLLTLFQNAYMEKSLNFAQAIQNQYRNNLKTINRGVKQAELFVLYKTAMPSVLTEIGFISNPTEEAFMLSEEGQAKIAICIFNAFMNFKATEEGSNKPANVVYNIAGYKAAGDKKEEPQQQEVAEKVAPIVEEAAPVVEEVAPPQEVQTKPEPVKEEPRQEQTVEVEATPQAKPTPTVSLPEPKAEPKQEPRVESKPEPKPAPVKETLIAPQNSAAADAGQYFTVQFLTSKNEYRAGAPELCGVSDFQTFRQGKNIAYITGRFATREEAAAYCEHLKRATPFKDAWCYLHKDSGKKEQQPTTATEAKPATQSAQSSQPSATAGAVTYRIQFCTATREMKVGDPDLHGIKDFRSGKSGKVYIYTTGNFSKQADALRRCNEIKRTTPFKDAFVIAIHKGQRISLEQAAKLEK